MDLRLSWKTRKILNKFISCQPVKNNLGKSHWSVLPANYRKINSQTYGTELEPRSNWFSIRMSSWEIHLSVAGISSFTFVYEEMELAKPRHTWQDNIKIDVETWWDGMVGIYFAENGDQRFYLWRLRHTFLFHKMSVLSSPDKQFL